MGFGSDVFQLQSCLDGRLLQAVGGEIEIMMRCQMQGLEKGRIAENLATRPEQTVSLRQQGNGVGNMFQHTVEYDQVEYTIGKRRRIFRSSDDGGGGRGVDILGYQVVEYPVPQAAANVQSDGPGAGKDFENVRVVIADACVVEAEY